MTDKIAGIDVHKRVLMVVVGTPGALAEQDFLIGRFGTTSSELGRLAGWLQQCGVREVVMESTAQYWKPVWMSLEADFRLFLAQAWSNRAPRGKKADFKDAKRLVRRHCAGELTLSFVPDAEQRQMRSLTRRREQLTRDRVRILNQVESLLEETRIKLSSVVSDLFGGSGMRILKALSEGISDPVKLAALADPRVQRTAAELADALTGTLSPIHQRILKQHLAMLELIDQQMQELLTEIGASMSEHADAIKRLCAIPGIRVLAAQQILAEVGPGASEFDSPPQFTSWAGVCPGKNESAGENHSSRCAKGNIYLRRVLCQVRKRGANQEQPLGKHLPPNGTQARLHQGNLGCGSPHCRRNLEDTPRRRGVYPARRTQHSRGTQALRPTPQEGTSRSRVLRRPKNPILRGSHAITFNGA